MDICRCPNADSMDGRRSPPRARDRGHSPRLYHMSLISKPICLLMSPYLRGRNGKSESQSTGRVKIRPGLLLSATQSSITESHKEKKAHLSFATRGDGRRGKELGPHLLITTHDPPTPHPPTPPRGTWGRWWREMRECRCPHSPRAGERARLLGPRGKGVFSVPGVSIRPCRPQ